nr:MAG TPA: hypothetical protein [Caudoviricetes sp.]
MIYVLSRDDRRPGSIGAPAPGESPGAHGDGVKNLPPLERLARLATIRTTTSPAPPAEEKQTTKKAAQCAALL